MKKLFLLLSAIFIISILTATPIEYDILENAAINWYEQATNSSSSLSETFSTESEGIITSYTFNFSEGGFIILSADDNVFPILAFDFDNYAPSNVTDEAVKWRKPRH